MMIAEAAALCGITSVGIRYYERIGLLAVARDKNGIRDFSTENIKRLLYIKEMKEMGLSIKALQKFFALEGQLETSDAKARQQQILKEEFQRLTQEMNDLLQKRQRLQKIAAAEPEAAAGQEKWQSELADAS